MTNKLITLIAMAILSTGCGGNGTSANGTAPQKKEKATVYFTEEITPESLIRIYEALGRKATGKVAVKISTGEQG